MTVTLQPTGAQVNQMQVKFFSPPLVRGEETIKYEVSIRGTVTYLDSDGAKKEMPVSVSLRDSELSEVELAALVASMVFGLKHLQKDAKIV